MGKSLRARGIRAPSPTLRCLRPGLRPLPCCWRHALGLHGCTCWMLGSVRCCVVAVVFCCKWAIAAQAMQGRCSQLPWARA